MIQIYYSAKKKKPQTDKAIVPRQVSGGGSKHRRSVRQRRRWSTMSHPLQWWMERLFNWGVTGSLSQEPQKGSHPVSSCARRRKSQSLSFYLSHFFFSQKYSKHTAFGFVRAMTAVWQKQLSRFWRYVKVIGSGLEPTLPQVVLLVSQPEPQITWQIEICDVNDDKGRSRSEMSFKILFYDLRNNQCLEKVLVVKEYFVSVGEIHLFINIS